MIAMLSPSRETRVNVLVGIGHFLSHFYVLSLPALFLAWQHSFGVSFAELGLSVALMAGVTALLQTPMGFLVDRFGARPFLIGGTLLMTLSMAAMSLAGAYWQVAALAALSGVGNSVIHPVDYAILTGSMKHSRMGSSFAFHTFSGNLGSAAAPPVTATLMLLCGWRVTMLLLGLLGIPLVLLLIWQSGILKDQVRQPRAAGARRAHGARLLLTRPMLLFFAFFLLSAMSTAGIQAWLITVLHEVNGLGLEAASAVLTGYMVGQTGGVLVGGFVADRTRRVLGFTIVATVCGAALILLVALLRLPELPTLALLFVAGILVGASRTPRDVMVKDAAPPGQVGKVFGFVSAGLPLGTALTPVPFGMLIDGGRPDLVLVLVTVLLLASLLFAGGAKMSAGQATAAQPAEAD